MMFPPSLFSYKTLVVPGLVLVGIGIIAYLQFAAPDVLLNPQASVTNIALRALARCQDQQRPQVESKEVCYAKAFEDIAFDRGPEEAFVVLSALQEKDPDARGCHFIAHGIGYGTYKRDPTNWRQHIQTMSPSCSQGGYMGIVERYTESLPKGIITKEFIPTICGPNPRADCNHIVGHILLADSTIQGDIDKALELCSSIQENAQQYYYCITGVFMEHITAFNLIAHGYAPESFLNWPARLPELEALCSSSEGLFGEACWEELAHVIAVKFNNDAASVFAFCREAPTVEAAKKCVYHSIGIMAGAEYFKIYTLRDICQISLPDEYDFPARCYRGLVSSILSSIPQELPQVVDFCGTVEGRKSQKVCFTQIGYTLRASIAVAPSILEAECLAAPDEFQTHCRGTFGQRPQTPGPRTDLNLLP